MSIKMDNKSESDSPFLRKRDSNPSILLTSYAGKKLSKNLYGVFFQEKKKDKK